MHEATASDLPPGPGWPLAAETLAAFLAPTSFLRWCRRRYGRAFTLRIAPIGTGVWLTEPRDVKEVFTADPSLLHAGEGSAALAPLLGERSVILSDGEDHLRRRKLMLPMFHGEAVREYAELMADVATEKVASWRPGVMRLHPRMQALTLEIILRAVLGVDRAQRTPELHLALRRVLDISSVQMLLFLEPRLGRVGPWKRHREIQAHTDRLLYAEIAARRGDPRLGERTDILSALVQARYEDATPLDDRDVRDQLMTLLVAGHETTATGLAWAFERLVRHPEHLREAVAAADADDAEHLDAIAKETLRVRPVIVDVIRNLTRPAEFAGHRLAAGTMILPSILCVQDGPEWGPDPESFDPGRWTRGAPPGYGWIPFGGGTRRCLGAAFAQMEMRIVLREVLRAVELRPVLGAGEPRRMRHITSVPAFGTLVRVRPRERSACSATGRAAAEPALA